MHKKTDGVDSGLPHGSNGAKAVVSTPDSIQGLASAAAEAAEEVESLEANLAAATLAKALAFLHDVDAGKIPFDPAKGAFSIRVSEYSYKLATHLTSVLGLSRKEIITLALCHYARALTSAHVTTQNDLALLTKGMQFVVQDLTMEVAEFNRLAIEVANQEAVSGNPPA